MWRRGPSSGGRNSNFGGPQRQVDRGPGDWRKSGGNSGGSVRDMMANRNQNRFDMGTQDSRGDFDSRPAHLRNRFRRSGDDSQDVRSNRAANSSENLPKQKQRTRVIPTVKVKEEKIIKIKRTVALAPELLANRATKNSLTTPLEDAVEKRSQLDAKQLVASFGALDLKKTPVAPASLVLANSLVDRKFTVSDLVSSVRDSNSVSEARQVLLGICKVLKTKGKKTLLTDKADDTTAVVELLSQGLDEQAFAKLLVDEDIEYLAPADELSTELMGLLSAAATPADVLAVLDAKQDSKRNASALKAVVVLAILERVYKTKTANLSVVDEFQAVLARFEPTEEDAEPDVAIETDILFAAQHAWCKAGASRKTIRPLFEKLYEAKIVSFQGLVTWRDDRVRGHHPHTPQLPSPPFILCSFLAHT